MVRCWLRLPLQDVLVVTAPGSGAEIIPFLKTWVNLPMAIAFTIGYAKVSPSAAAGQLAVSDSPSGVQHLPAIAFWCPLTAFLPVGGCAAALCKADMIWEGKLAWCCQMDCCC